MSSSKADKATNEYASMLLWRRRAYTIWAFIGGCILLFALGFLLNVLAIPVGILIWTAVIVFCLRGIVNWLQENGLSRMMAVVCSYAVLLVVLGLTVLLISSPFFGIGDQFQSMVADIPKYIASVQLAYSNFIADNPEILQNPIVAEAIKNAANSAMSSLNGMMQNSVGGLVDIGTLVVNSCICIGFASVVAFWMLLALPDMGREVKRIMGEQHYEVMDFIYLTFTRVVGGYIRGVLVQCALITVGTLILFFVLGIPNAVAFAIITGIMNVIPVIGPWLGGIAAGLAALGTSPLTALLAVIFVVVIQQVVYTFVSPKIMGNTVDVHPMLVIFAMMIGWAVGLQMSGFIGGLTGMLLGIPAAAFIKTLFVFFL